jgi:protein TonB
MSGGARRKIGVAALWSIAVLGAAAGHAAIAAIALNWVPSDTAPSAAPPVVMISLAPAAPEVPEQSAAPGPTAADARPEPNLTEPEKTAEPEPDMPNLPEQEQAVAVLPPPMPEPRPEAKPVRDVPEVKREDHKKTERKVASRAAAPATFHAQRAASASAHTAGAARVPAVATASWKNQLMSELNRHKRYPPGTSGTGTALVAFSMNHAGQVTSSRLVRSSGDRALDDEAVALPRRASPLPKPPDGLASGSIALTVPIRFGRN